MAWANLKQGWLNTDLVAKIIFQPLSHHAQYQAIGANGEVIMALTLEDIEGLRLMSDLPHAGPND
jgi:hypothetical protein